MKNRILTMFSILCLLFTACAGNKETKQESYTISAKINGLEDGSRVLLADLYNQVIVDSCLVQDGKIYFEGEAKTPIHAILRMFKKDGKGWEGFIGVSKTFFLDNSNFTLDTDTTNMAKTYFEGSKVNDMVNELDKSMQVYRSKMESSRNGRESANVTEEDQKKSHEESQLAFKKMLAKEKEFILSHPDIYPAFYMLNKHVISYANYQKALANPELSGGMMPMEPAFTKEELEPAYKNASEKYKNSDMGKAIYSILFEEKAQVGKAYIEFADTYTMDGKSFKVSDVKTEYVLLNFTGVKCGWCKVFNRHMMPHYDKVKDKLTIVAFYTDTEKESIVNSVEKEGLPWTITSDFKGDNSVNKKHYSITGIPDFYLLDKNRNIIKQVSGFNEEFVKELSELK